LDQDIQFMSPNGLRSLIRARSVTETEHDIHDANPTHQQGNGCHPTQENGEHIGDCAGGGEEILLCQDGEVIRTNRGAVACAQDLGNLFACGTARAGNFTSSISTRSFCAVIELHRAVWTITRLSALKLKANWIPARQSRLASIRTVYQPGLPAGQTNYRTSNPEDDGRLT
jgi:hypothetical protein